LKDFSVPNKNARKKRIWWYGKIPHLNGTGFLSKKTGINKKGPNRQVIDDGDAENAKRGSFKVLFNSGLFWQGK
jgi:hypothetical protein